MSSVSQMTADTGFAQRLKALACTAPLHDLDSRKGQVGQGEFAGYQMSELALHAIDLVTLAMDFDHGARPEQVLADLVPFARAQAPDRDAGEHERVARWVLDNLVNVGSADRGFRAIYGVTTADGGYERLRFDFKLLAERSGPTGEIYLRATDEAVNVLIGALEVDIASAQVAADLKLETLIRRGRLSDAQAAAQTARYRTIQYGELLRQRLEATERDVRSVDWLTEMPSFVTEALGHIEDRFRAENLILVNIREARDTADTPQRKQQAAVLVEIVRDCLRRHEQLQTALQDAGRRFRAEQDRQAFAAPPVRAEIDLHAQLLVPTLELAVADAERPTDQFFSAGTGLEVPRALRLIDLYESLLLQPAEQKLLGEELADPDLSAATEPERFTEEQYDALDALLDLDPEAPQRLSGLLATARRLDPDLPLLVVVRVLALAAEEIGPARRRRAASVLITVDDGTPLDDPDFGGADLIVARAAVVPAPSTGTDVPARATPTRQEQELMAG